MRRVMLLDDEPYVRRMMRELGSWETCGYEIACECINGEEALNWLRQNDCAVDVIFCDMKMPVMDGLSFMKAAAELYPQLYFVVVSAYDDFSLTRNAFLLGAKEYLLKSEMTRTDIDQVLERLRMELDIREREGEERAQVSSALLGHLLQQAANEVLSADELSGLTAALPKAKDGLAAVCISYTGSAQKQKQAFSCVREYVRRKGGAAEAVKGREHFFLLQGDMLREGTGQSGTEALLFFLRGLQRELQESALLVNIGCYDGIPDYMAVPKAVRMAARVCACSFIQGNGQIYIWSGEDRCAKQAQEYFGIDGMRQGGRGIPIETKRTADLRSDERVKCLQAMLRGDSADESFLIVEQERLNWGDIRPVWELYRRYLYELADYAKEREPEPKQRQALEEYRRLIKEYADLDTLNTCLSELLALIQRGQEIQTLMDKVTGYIDRNFAKDITLTGLSEQFFVTSSYLSRLFPQYCGMNFVDYLTSVRIRKARELMSEGSLKLYEIGERVGFHSSEHFSRAFKRVTGKSPREYMKEKSARAPQL